MARFHCAYSSSGSSLGKERTIEAKDHKEAYTKFVKEVSLEAKTVYVRKGFFGLFQEFKDHIDEINQLEKKERLAKEIEQRELQKKEDLDDAIKANKRIIIERENLEKSAEERKLKVENTELVDVLDMLKEINENIKSYGSRILWMLFAIAMGIMGIKFLLD